MFTLCLIIIALALLPAALRMLGELFVLSCWLGLIALCCGGVLLLWLHLLH